MKLLFTVASETDIPYLKGAPSWRANVHKAPGECSTRPEESTNCEREVQTVRLIQLDVAVKDDNAEKTGWVFGTLVFNGNRSPLEAGAIVPAKRLVDRESVWNQLEPVGLAWGNDPSALSSADLRETMRTKDETSSVFQHLGCLDRLNGPVDNPAASCVACHALARFPAPEPDNFPMRFPACGGTTIGDDGRVTAVSAAYFRNLSGDQVIDDLEGVELPEKMLLGDNELMLLDDNEKMLLGDKRHLERAQDDLSPAIAVKRACGTMRTGAQAHFYMEPQAILAVPDDDGGITLTASSQHLEACQQAVADALHLPAHKVRVKTARLGGGFGGKETRTPPIAAVAALAAMHVRQPVRLVLERDADTTIVGYRHPFEGRYEVAFDGDGQIHELNLEFALDGGNSKDVTPHVLDLAVLSADGAYLIPRFRVDGASYRTSRMTRTAMRTFGVIQCSLIRETAIEHVAHALHMLPEKVRQRNFYPDSKPDREPPSTPYGQKLHHCIINDVWQRLLKDANFRARAAEVARFNRRNRWGKRGISMLPIKYGVAYTYVPYNQGSAYVTIYAKDGTILVHTGAVEMGQGVNTKLGQLAADVLGVPLEMVEVAPSSTEVIPNASSSGASTGADLHGGALMRACRILRQRLESMCRLLQDDARAENRESKVPTGWEQPDVWKANWSKIVRLAYDRRLNLSAQAHYQSPRLTGYDFDGKPGTPFLYFTYSAACSEVEIDVLTGEFNVRRADIIYDAGRSLNPTIDIGQIQGGFVQGMGNVTTEEIYYDDSGGGAPLTSNFWNYKPPCSKTIPAEFNTRIYQYDNAALNALIGEPFAVWRSKSTGEPPAVLANSVFFAIRHAVAAARKEQGWSDWFEFDAPATVARIQRACRERDTVGRAVAAVAHAR